jgi:hypothetical protein
LAGTAEDTLKKLIKDCLVLQQQFICLRAEAQEKKGGEEEACMHDSFKGCPQKMLMIAKKHITKN